MFVNNPFPPAFPAWTSPFGIQQTKVKSTSDEGEPRFINFLAGNDGCAAYRRGFLSNHIKMSKLGDVTDLTKMVGEKAFYHGIKTVTLQLN